MSDNGGSDLDVFDNLSKAPAPARKKTLVGMAAPQNPALGSSDRASMPPPPPPSLRTSVPPPPPPSRVSQPTIDDSILAAAAEAEEIEEVDALEEDSSPVAADAQELTEAEEITGPGEPPSAEDVTGPNQSLAAADTGELAGEVTAANEVTTANEIAGGEVTDAHEITEADVLTDALPVAASSEQAEPVNEDLYADDDATQVFSTLDSSPEAVTEDPPTPLIAMGSSPVAVPPPGAATASRPLPPPPSVFRSSGPPPPPPTPSAAPAPPSAGEWDDDDDKTSVFNRESGFDAAHMLMGTSQVGSVPVGTLPDVPPPPMSRPSAPIPSPPVVSMPAPAPHYSSAAPGSVPPVGTNRTPLMLGAIAALVLGIALFFILRPSTGGLVVTVAGPGSEPISGVEVVVDGKVACTASPCTLQELQAGTHMVQARAAGYAQTAESAVLITSGQDAVQNIRLAKAGGTGVRVSGTGAGLKLYVDGQDKGPLPAELKELSPGKHTLKVAGDQFATWERSVTVAANEMQSIEVPPLEVVKGLAIIKAGTGADGARIVLEADGDRRVLPSLPMNLHIDTSKPHRLVASRSGYETFRKDLVFEKGQAEKTFEIELRQAAAPEPPSHASPPSAGRPSPPPSAAGGQATLNINSIPASRILLDGRPIGMTPKRGVSVSAGPHTVVFIHDDDRATKSVRATAGQTSTVVHRFK